MMKKVIFPLTLFFFLFSSLKGQSNFSLENYINFLNSHQNLTYEQLLNLYPSGSFLESISKQQEYLYSDSVSLKYELTDYEKDLLNKHGFMVTERVSKESFLSMIEDIFHKDLPLFISTDAILYAVHNSYDRILWQLEFRYLYDKLKSLLYKLDNSLDVIQDKYADNPQMSDCLDDVDIYINVARSLLNTATYSHFSKNRTKIAGLLDYINQYQPKIIDLFGDKNRKLDFSQFKPRGHYESDRLLKKYFKAMIWLGRTELYLMNPGSSLDTLSKSILKRQATDSFLIKELLDIPEIQSDYRSIENMIKIFIGEQDNVTYDDLLYLSSATGINSADELLNDSTYSVFTDTLKNQAFAYQKILSQLLAVDPTSPDSLVPAVAFMLFGQRFVIDSYITSSVVYDKIKWMGEKVRRMLPNTLDIAFSLGNNSAGVLLKPELEKYHYSSNLAALRYLIESYDETYWDATVYLGWLNLIKILSPSEDRNNLPEFMQTAAWWQEKLNTQLASWTELRHDNLLYAKQSYTGIPICSFPYIYAEPNPEFYKALKRYSENVGSLFSAASNSQGDILYEASNYFKHVNAFADTMISITEKELDNEAFSQAEIDFLQRFLSIQNGGGCVPSQIIEGWYPNLFFGLNLGLLSTDNLLANDYLVADYHTSATDENGMPVGWVAHSGTGPVNLMVVNAELPGVGPISFCGPAYSYYEYVTTNFNRITDSEWQDNYLSLAERPSWVNLYLADENGNYRGDGLSLLTSVEGFSDNFKIKKITGINYPNPFNPSTFIKFTVPNFLSGEKFNVTIYNSLGERIKVLLDDELQSGNYLIKWDGSDSYNRDVASGIYFYNISAGDSKFTGKMILIR